MLRRDSMSMIDCPRISHSRLGQSRSCKRHRVSVCGMVIVRGERLMVGSAHVVEGWRG